jgi:hypothetical protein
MKQQQADDFHFPTQKVFFAENIKSEYILYRKFKEQFFIYYHLKIYYFVSLLNFAKYLKTYLLKYKGNYSHSLNKNNLK